MVIFPLAPDQTIAQMWSNGARGGNEWRNALLGHIAIAYNRAYQYRCCSVFLQIGM